MYTDPLNTPDILSQLQKAPTLKEISTIIENTFPSWIVAVLPKYSEDYKHLTTNWNALAKMSNVTPTEIIIVDEMVFDDEHTLIRTFGELLTSVGYIVRRKTEFQPCSVCNNAIPNEFLYNQMKEKFIDVPENWSTKCVGC